MSKKLSMWLVVLLLIVPLVAAACGEDDDDNGGGGNAADLTQEFKSALGFTVKYPEGWAAQDGGAGVEIANKAEYLEAGTEDTIPEDAVLVMFMPPFAGADLGLGEDASVKDVLGMMAQGEGAEAGEAKDVKIGDKDAVRVDMKEADSKSEGFFVGYKVDDTHIVIAIVAASEGKLDDYESTALKIIESATYAAPEGGAG
jgi:hypothetical protein